MAGTIFLNYRRGDDPGTALALFGQLEQVFSKERLFMDVEGHIKAGDDYVDVLRGQVARCDVLLAVIGPRWLSLADETGRRRLDNPTDWVRLEIVKALEAGSAKRVIPVLVGGAAMPRADDLPDDLKPLARKQAIRITLERFRPDTQGLIDQINGILADLDAARTAATEAERAAALEALRRHEADEAARAAQAEVRAREQRRDGLSADQIRTAEELANWEFIKTRDNIDDLRDHLARFPGGGTERYARVKLEDVAWAAIAAKATLQELQAYIVEFPASPHVDNARERARLERQKLTEAAAAAEREAAENAAWAMAAGKDKAAVQAFLKTWPKGQHTAAAKARLRELRGSRFSRRALAKGVGYGIGSIVFLWIALFTAVQIGFWWNDRSLKTFYGHTTGVMHVALTDDGAIALSIDAGKVIKLWDVETGRELRAVSSAPYTVLAPDGKTQLSAEYKDYGDSGFALRNTINSRIIVLRESRNQSGYDSLIGGSFYPGFSGEYKGHPGGTLSYAVSGDGRYVLSGGHDDTVKLWDKATRRELRTFTGHRNSVYSVALSNDGKIGLSGSLDRTVKLWDLMR